MRIEIDEITEGLHEENHARSAPLADACIGPHEQPLYDVAQPPQQCAPAGEDRAQHAGHGEHVLPVRHRRKHVRLDPLAVDEHALLVAARTEIPGLAREREDATMAAIPAAQPGKAMMRVAAFEEALDDVLLDAAREAIARFQLRRLPDRTLVECARVWLARPVNPAARSLRRMRASLHDTSNAAKRQDGAGRTPLSPCDFVSRRKQSIRDRIFVTK